jgi:predicted nucleotidyltransferase
METDINILDLIKSTIQFFLPGAEVILFGSRARGENHLHSDYDLLIIVNTVLDNPERLRNQALIRKALAMKHILADVILHSRDEIDVKRNLPGHMVRTALREGIKV